MPLAIFGMWLIGIVPMPLAVFGAWLIGIRGRLVRISRMWLVGIRGTPVGVFRMWRVVGPRLGIVLRYGPGGRGPQAGHKAGSAG
jgi:hypothetical protein